MSYGGDEILRAVLTQGCTYAGYASYLMEQQFSGAAFTCSVQLQGKQDTFFLITSLTPYVIKNIGGGDGTVTFGDDLPVTIMLRDASAHKNKMNIDGTLNQWGSPIVKEYTMPNYWLLEPASTIILDIDPTNIPTNSFVGVHLNGIEYRE